LVKFSPPTLEIHEFSNFNKNLLGLCDVLNTFHDNI